MMDRDVRKRDVESDIVNVLNALIYVNKAGRSVYEDYDEQLRLFTDDLKMLMQIRNEYEGKEEGDLSNFNAEKMLFKINVNGKEYKYSPAILPSVAHNVKYQRTANNRMRFTRTQLVSIVSEFEYLFSKLVTSYYTDQPGSLNNKEVNIRLEDVKNYSSLEELRDELIQKQVDSLLSKSIEEWIDFLKSLKIEFFKITPNLDQFKDYFAKRNLIVHNDGRVNRRYKDKFPDTTYSIGDQISFTFTDLMYTFEDFVIVGITLSLMMWNQCKPKDRQAIYSVAADVCYIALTEKDWRLAERCSDLMIMYKSNPQEELTARMNKFLSLKRQERFQEVQGELTSFSHATSHPKYSAVIYALLEDDLNLAATLKVSGVELGDLIEWPIFEDVRKKEYFQNHLEYKLLEHAEEIQRK